MVLKLHIVIFPSELFLPEGSPLSGIFQYQQALSLSSKIKKIGVISFGFHTVKHFFKRNEYKKHEHLNNINVVRIFTRLFFPHRLHGRSKLAEMYINGYRRCFLEYISYYGMPDLIHAHNYYYAGISAADIGKEFDIPVIVTEHSSLFLNPSYKNISHEFAIKASKIAAATISVSSGLANSLNEKGIRSGLNFVIPNIIDPAFVFNENKNNYGAKRYTFISIGEFDDNKNQILILEALNSLINNGKSANLVLVGIGPQKNNLQNYVYKKLMSNYVDFYGYATRDEIRSLLNQSDCFVLASKWETFGVVLIEALSQGLPIIATDCGGPSDIIDESNGVLVNNNNSSELYKAMKYFCDNVDKFDRELIKSNAIKKYYTIPQELILNLYNKILQFKD